jgi:hypothetical protein
MAIQIKQVQDLRSELDSKQNLKLNAVPTSSIQLDLLDDYFQFVLPSAPTTIKLPDVDGSDYFEVEITNIGDGTNPVTVAEFDDTPVVTLSLSAGLRAVYCYWDGASWQVWERGFYESAATFLKQSDIGVTVQAYSPNTVVDSEYASVKSQVAVNTAKVSASGSIDSHSDVDLSGISPGQILQWNGTQLVPGNQSSGGAKNTISATEPSSPAVGDVWRNSFDLRKCTYYDGAWIELEGLIPVGDLELIGSVGGTTTATLPEHRAGDVIIVCSSASSTAPTLASGYTQLQVITESSESPTRLAYRIATGSDTPAGTWTGAEVTIWLIYRNADGTSPIASSAIAGDTNMSSFTIPGLTLSSTDDKIIAFISLESSTTLGYGSINLYTEILQHIAGNFRMNAYQNTSSPGSTTWPSDDATHPSSSIDGAMSVVAIRPITNPLDLPSSPSALDTFSYGANSWIYDGTRWLLQ